MSTPSDRLNAPISTPELERRWKAIRAAMKRDGIDVLVMQNNNDHMGGYVKYVTDLPATNGYPIGVVFPADDLMSVVCQGPIGLEKDLKDGTDGVWRGVKRVMHTASYACAPYTRQYDGTLMLKALQGYSTATIGLVGTYGMSAALSDQLRDALPQARFVEASDLVDAIKVIKSAEEIARIRDTTALQDAAMRAAFDAIQPGMTDKEVAAVAADCCFRLGAEMGIWLVGSYKIGQPSGFGPWHFANRRIEKGDALSLLVETNGPGGYYCELGRTCVLGDVPARMQDEFAFVLEARQFTLDLLKPGTSCKTIWDEYNAFMERNGRPKEARLYCHGQGYDLVERPLIRDDEPMPIAADTLIVVHPTYIANGALNWACDDYLIGQQGVLGRLHAFPEAITAIAV
jgi:Xaa-Pro aminopeptidase